ncbi:MAG: inositol monophosphatase family protein [bacterium]
MADDALHARLEEIALRAARAAGRLLLDRPESLTLTAKSSPTDIVTEMDRAAEDLLVSMILAERPDDGILGEEGGARHGTSSVRWVIDPLDGTTNYVYRVPFWAVSVAAEVDGRVVVGVVEAPALGRTYAARRGSGAWVLQRFPEDTGPTPLRASGLEDLSHALVSTGFGYAPERRRRQAEDLRLIAPSVRDIRRLGAASLDLAWVGAGNSDAYFESGLKPWDLAAGCLIAREAGAVVTGLHGREPDEDLVLAAAPGIAAEVGRLVDAAMDTR